MIDFLLAEYLPYTKDELEYLKRNISNPEIIEEHISLLEHRNKRFIRFYRINTWIIKFVPVLALVLFLLYPRDYQMIFISALMVIVLFEFFKSIFFPHDYFEKINSNIVILKSILKLNKE